MTKSKTAESKIRSGNSRIWKKITLVLAIVSVLISGSWLIWNTWFRPSIVSIEAIRGSVAINRRFDKLEIKEGGIYNIVPGDVLLLPEKSEILLVFNNGQNITMEGQKELSMTSSNKFGNDQLFVFQDQITGKNFSYSIKFGLDKANAAVVANVDNATPNVLGATETKNNDDSKLEKLTQVFDCMLENKKQEKDSFVYKNSLKYCLSLNGLESLDNLK